MRLQDNVFAPHAAPTAGVSVASFHEVDGALVLGTPRAFDDLVARLIDLDEAAGRQNGKHGEILHADVAIGEVAVGKLRQVGEGNQAPLFDHASEIGGTAGVKAGIHAQRNLYGRQAGQSLGDMRLGRRD